MTTLEALLTLSVAILSIGSITVMIVAHIKYSATERPFVGYKPYNNLYNYQNFDGGKNCCQCEPKKVNHSENTGVDS